MREPSLIEDELPQGTPLSESEWRDLRGLVYESSGINLSEAKRIFLVSRLLKRLRATGISSFRRYFQQVTAAGQQSEEYQHLVNAVTTNKTNFFREQQHFDILSRWLRSASPQVKRAKAEGLRIWCAATSTGEEPYTIAAVVRDSLSPEEWARASILASDIDTAVLATARRAVYQASSVDAVEARWKTKMFVPGSGDFVSQFRIRRELREHVVLFQHNLVQPRWQVGDGFDAIFCRNVLIYFDRPTQTRVVRQLMERLGPEGLLFLGYAESLSGLAVSARAVAHSVYCRTGPGSLRPGPSTLWAEERAKVVARAAPLVQAERRAVQERSVVELLRGQTVMDASGWLKLRLKDGVLLLVYDRIGQSNAVTYFNLRGRANWQEELPREASRMSQAINGRTGVLGGLRSKVILSQLGTSGPIVDVRQLTTEFSLRGLELLAVRQMNSAALVSVEARRGRIRLWNERHQPHVQKDQEFASPLPSANAQEPHER